MDRQVWFFCCKQKKLWLISSKEIHGKDTVVKKNSWMAEEAGLEKERQLQEFL